MDEFRMQFEESTGVGDGRTVVVRVYDTTQPGYAVAYDECVRRASAFLQKPSAADLAASYQLELKFLACLDSAGFETGTPVSEDEWVASGGLADPSSNWSILANSNDPAFNTAYTACFTSVAAEG